MNIMKMIDHEHVICLSEVYETPTVCVPKVYKLAYFASAVSGTKCNYNGIEVKFALNERRL